MLIAAWSLMMAVGGAGAVPAVTTYQTMTATIYSDHWEKGLPRHWVAAYTITYSSSVPVSMTDYGGGRKRRCRYSFGNPQLTRRFTYEGIHQARPYQVMHLQSGERSWSRVPPLPPVDAVGRCADLLTHEIANGAAKANALAPWKTVVAEDDAIVRRFLKLGSANPDLRQ